MRTWEGSSGLSNLRKDEATEVLNLLEETEESSVQLQLCYPRYWSQDSVCRVLQAPCHESNRWTILPGDRRTESGGTCHSPDLQWLTAHSVEWNHLPDSKIQEFHEISGLLGSWSTAGKMHFIPQSSSFAGSKFRLQSNSDRSEGGQPIGWSGMIFFDFLGHSPSFNTY